MKTLTGSNPVPSACKKHLIIKKEEELGAVSFDLGEKIRVSPSTKSENNDEIQPGDLSRFAPYGNCVYGHQKDNRSNPFKSAPLQESCGGVVYFGNGISKAHFEVLIQILGVKRLFTDFAVFVGESQQPEEDGYLVQLRTVSRFGLCYLFGALAQSEYDRFPVQEIGVGEVFWNFLELERQRWGTHFWQDKDKGLKGLFGGDGYFAREELAFGFMVENDHYGIYRIWSRAWLVTK